MGSMSGPDRGRPILREGPHLAMLKPHWRIPQSDISESSVHKPANPMMTSRRLTRRIYGSGGTGPEPILALSERSAAKPLDNAVAWD